MFSSVRSVRVRMGRIPSAAHASMSAFAGKQNRYSVPSSFKIFAIAALPVIIVSPFAVSFTNPAMSFLCEPLILARQTGGSSNPSRGLCVLTANAKGGKGEETEERVWGDNLLRKGASDECRSAR